MIGLVDAIHDPGKSSPYPVVRLSHVLCVVYDGVLLRWSTLLLHPELSEAIGLMQNDILSGEREPFL